MTNAERFRVIETTAKAAAEQCEAKTAEDLEIGTWAQEILTQVQQIKPSET